MSATDPAISPDRSTSTPTANQASSPGKRPASAPIPIGQRYLEAEPAELDYRVAATTLRNVLRLNGEFSGMTGLAATILAGPVANLLGVAQVWIIRGLGISLLGFSISLFVLAGRRNAEIRAMSTVISAADVGWVMGTIAIVALGWLSTAGAVIMALVAVVVSAFAVGQFRARSKMVASETSITAPNELPPIEIVRMRRTMAVSAAKLWPVMTDHELYAKLARNLGGAKGLTPNGPDLRRSCTDAAGRTWTETCTLWDDGHRFDVNIDIDDYPYPLQVMQGSWAVTPTGTDQADVTMTFALQPERGIRGAAFVPAMHLLFKPILVRIAKGWRRVAAAS